MNTNPKYTKSILQIVVACYVIYLAYGLRDGIMEKTGNERLWFIIAACVLAIGSILIIIRAAKNMFEKDVQEDMEQENQEQEKENDSNQ